jgi:dynein heavy chain
MNMIVSQVRGKLTKLERKTIGAMITLDVHARDVVKELADEDLREETDFSWISQLRLIKIDYNYHVSSCRNIK